jgi:hypothetical protein
LGTRSLKREFEVVIMVEVLIGEMVGSERFCPLAHERAVIVDAEKKETEKNTKEKNPFR